MQIQQRPIRLMSKVFFMDVKQWTSILFLLFFSSSPRADVLSDFSRHCTQTFLKEGVCPLGICEFRCEDESQTTICESQCLPKPCPTISKDECPLSFCALMVDCSGETICHYQMMGEKPACGELAYAGQDIECCPGLVRRCGIEFLDQTCDMEGRNSVYSLPICISCGDGICTQFENICNCPEDCGGGDYEGVVFEQIREDKQEDSESQFPPMKNVQPDKAKKGYQPDKKIQPP